MFHKLIPVSLSRTTLLRAELIWSPLDTCLQRSLDGIRCIFLEDLQLASCMWFWGPYFVAVVGITLGCCYSFICFYSGWSPMFLLPSSLPLPSPLLLFIPTDEVLMWNSNWLCILLRFVRSLSYQVIRLKAMVRSEKKVQARCVLRTNCIWTKNNKHNEWIEKQTYKMYKQNEIEISII